MSAPQSFNLAGDSATTAKFEKVGDGVTGTVVGLTERQSTKLGTTELDFWPDGKPKMYYSLMLQTALREEAGDDGKRSVALTGSKKSSEQSSLSAVLDAVMAATGGTEIQVGGTVSLQMVGQAPPKTVGYNPRKLYAASYVAPVASMNLGKTAEAVPAQANYVQPAGFVPPVAQQPALLPQATVPPAVQQMFPQAAPVAAPVAAAAGAQFSPEQLAAMAAAGVDVTLFGATV